MSEMSLDEEVLLKISQGSNTFYALTVKEKAGSNDGVLAALNRLQINRLVEKGKLGPRNSQPYLITEDGFDYIIRAQLDKIRDFDTFAKYCVEYFTLVFGYWKELNELGLGIYIKDSLGGFVKEIYFDVFRDLSLGRVQGYSHQKFIDDLCVRLYLPEMFKTDEELKSIPFNEIVEIRHTKQDIMNFIQKWIQLEKKSILNRLKRLEEVEKTL